MRVCCRCSIQVFKWGSSLAIRLPATQATEPHDKGVEIAERYRFSLYDSIIVASALLAGCKVDIRGWPLLAERPPEQHEWLLRD